MKKMKTAQKIGLAAAILIMPGGFILGGTLLANHWRKRMKHTNDDAESTA